jgi:hypothetical protein
MTHTKPTREKIARIIFPSGFEVEGETQLGKDWKKRGRQIAREKADAILTALEPARAGEVDGLVAEIDAAYEKAGWNGEQFDENCIRRPEDFNLTAPRVMEELDSMRLLVNAWPRLRAALGGGWRDDSEKRFFVGSEDADGDYFWPMTYKQMKEAVDRTFADAPHHGWPEGIDSYTVYELRPISRAVKTGEDEETYCEVCCGGEIDEWGPEGCPNCEDVGLVSSNDPTEPWHHDFEAITYYEMQPPLPPLTREEG